MLLNLQWWDNFKQWWIKVCMLRSCGKFINILVCVNQWCSFRHFCKRQNLKQVVGIIYLCLFSTFFTAKQHFLFLKIRAMWSILEFHLIAIRGHCRKVERIWNWNGKEQSTKTMFLHEISFQFVVIIWNRRLMWWWLILRGVLYLDWIQPMSTINQVIDTYPEVGLEPGLSDL